MAVDQPVALDASALGTKSYWDGAYKREVANHREDPDDEGTIWFDDTGAEKKMVDCLQHLFSAVDDAGETAVNKRSRLTTEKSTHQQRLLDIGCGNGHLLFSIRDEGYKAELLGIDYTEASVELANQIQRARRTRDEEPSEGLEDIRFEVADIFSQEVFEWSHGGFDVVLDKGTFDAISLSETIVNNNGQPGWQVYGQVVTKFMRPNGFFVLTSCNWTEEELRKWIEGPDLKLHTRLNYPSFTFGGVKGQSVTTLCFRRSARTGG